MTESVTFDFVADPARLVPVRAAPEHEPLLLEAAATAFEAMADAAGRDGIRLVAVSGFRGIERQTTIWNRKFRASLEVDPSRDRALEKVLEYSAPPGWSRHHLGTDLDLVADDLIADPRLEESDWLPGAAGGQAAAWLDRRARDYGFVRPYRIRRRGFRPEPWHCSFRPMAEPALRRMAAIDWSAWLAGEPFDGADRIAPTAAESFRRYVIEVDD